ncbi:MAG: MFS transporter [Pirellulaceae bacterium]
MFQISNLQLGIAFSAYGAVAMLSYFPGGPIADRFGARSLMSLALLFTAVGGLYRNDSRTGGAVVAVRVLGNHVDSAVLGRPHASDTVLGSTSSQGLAFGLLDSGRGFVAAGIGSISVYLYAWLLPADTAEIVFDDRVEAFKTIILFYTVLTATAAALIWAVLPKREAQIQVKRNAALLTGVVTTLRMPVIWLQALIIVCAYAAYKGLDDVSLYAREVLGMDEVSAAYTSTLSMWIRPIAAISAGLIADRFRASLMTAFTFLTLTFGCLVIASGLLPSAPPALFFITIIATSMAVFALRGLYFAVMNEGKIPIQYTGTAVGIVSAVGYMPDIFMGPLMGVLLDAWLGETGHRLLFLVLAGFALIGTFASCGYYWAAKKSRG